MFSSNIASSIASNKFIHNFSEIFWEGAGVNSVEGFICILVVHGNYKRLKLII